MQIEFSPWAKPARKHQRHIEGDRGEPVKYGIRQGQRGLFVDRTQRRCAIRQLWLRAAHAVGRWRSIDALGQAQPVHPRLRGFARAHRLLHPKRGGRRQKLVCCDRHHLPLLFGRAETKDCLRSFQQIELSHPFKDWKPRRGCEGGKWARPLKRAGSCRSDRAAQRARSGAKYYAHRRAAVSASPSPSRMGAPARKSLTSSAAGHRARPHDVGAARAGGLAVDHAEIFQAAAPCARMNPKIIGSGMAKHPFRARI